MNKRSPIGFSSSLRDATSRTITKKPRLPPTKKSSTSSQQQPSDVSEKEAIIYPRKSLKYSGPVVLVPVEEFEPETTTSSDPIPEFKAGTETKPVPLSVPVRVPVPVPVRVPVPIPTPVNSTSQAANASSHETTTSDTKRSEKTENNAQSESTKGKLVSTNKKSSSIPKTEGMKNTSEMKISKLAKADIDFIDVDVPKFNFRSSGKLTNSNNHRSSDYNMRSKRGDRIISGYEGCYSDIGKDNIFEYMNYTAGVTIDGMKIVKRDNLFPSCFGVTSDQAQCTFAVYLRKSHQGIGLKLKNVEGKVVIRGFAANYNELQADINNDLQINDIILSVDHRDVESAGFDKIITELRWSSRDQQRLEEIMKERKKFKDDIYTGPMGRDSSALLGITGNKNLDHGEVFTCLQIARVLSDFDEDNNYNIDNEDDDEWR